MRKLTTDGVLKEIKGIAFRELHIHHTWKPNHASFNGSNHIRINQNMKNYHVGNNGWSDIAQHLSLFPDGKWVTGRPYRRQPASIRGWNHRKPLMVEMIGNFDRGHDKLQGEQRKAIVQLVRYFIDKYGESSIVFHRDHPNAGKTCPGTSVIKSDLIKEAKALTKLTEADVRRIVTEMIKPSTVGENNTHWVDKDVETLKCNGIDVNDKRYNDLATRGELFAMIARLIEEK